jgi:hypothetical protein
MSSADLKETGGTHSATDAHRHDHVSNAAAFAFYERVTNQSRACHSVRVAD